LEPNARLLGAALGETGILVLSHGHHDHTGGVPQVLRIARKSEIYCHPVASQPRFSIRDGSPKPVQMPRESLAAIEEMPAQSFHRVSRPVSLSNRIGITGYIPRETSYEDTGGPFYLDSEGMRADPIDDDLAMWIRTDDGLVICVGCCHAGLVNSINHVRRLSDCSSIRAVIGGFHLLNAGSQRLDQTAAALRAFKPGMVVPCHCTGEHAVAVLRDALGNRVSPGAAGMTFRF
jgi:7,8-dihydropterin-6-yl-methyl-4-(beta-D-ribofuranosyl)aminobenzene 5'-phosphate synthase